MSLFAEDFDGPSDRELQTENDEGDGVVVAVTSFAGRTDQDDINLTDWMEDWQSNSQPGNADENYKSSPIDAKKNPTLKRHTNAILKLYEDCGSEEEYAEHADFLIAFLTTLKRRKRE